jgi:hypothetical protein
MKKLKVLGATISGLLFPVAIAFAQLTPPTKPGGLPGSSSDRISTVLTGYLTLFLGIVGLIAVGFLIYGGFRYITSAGNDEAAEGAKKTIQNSIIGLVIIILSYVIVTVIINAIGRGQA